jgi:cytosine/adenosine deaminase-related metal-dependent hydrolase
MTTLSLSLKHFDQPVDRTMQATERLIIPIIDLHWHAGVRANWRLTSDHGHPQFFGAGFPNTDAGRRGAAYAMSEAEAEVSAILNVLELLSGGCTTLVEVGASALLVQHLAQQVERFGVRAYLGPGYRSANYYRDAAGIVQYDWDENAGHTGLEVASNFIREYDGKAGGRVRGMLFPLQVDMLAQNRYAPPGAATDLRHCCRSIPARICGVPSGAAAVWLYPVELLAETGLLGPRTTLGHCLMVSGHPQAHYPDGHDLDLIAAAQANVAHCPVSLVDVACTASSVSYLARGITWAWHGYPSVRPYS